MRWEIKSKGRIEEGIFFFFFSLLATMITNTDIWKPPRKLLGNLFQWFLVISYRLTSFLS